MKNQKEFIGFNSINKLKEVLSEYAPKNIFLVTGKNSFQASGAAVVLEELLSGYRIINFSDFSINPNSDDLKKGIEYFKKNPSDMVIACGGGSAIDMAKLINVFSVQPGNFMDYIKDGKSISVKPRTLVAIPTTSGSGSEATHFAIIYIDKIKYSVAHEYILPDVAIIDPQFMLNLPGYVTASSGIDALSQAVESYWCVNSTAESKAFAKEAIGIILKNLPEAVNRPSKKSREEMAIAAHLSGKAINITKTTAPHAISYPLTSFFKLSHGHAVGMLMPEILVYNSEVNDWDVVDKRGAKYVKDTIKELNVLFGAGDNEEAESLIKDFMKSIGLATRLGEIGIREPDIEKILDNVDPDRLGNNPRRLTRQALKTILKKLL